MHFHLRTGNRINSLAIKGELAAGSNDLTGLSSGHAVRIFTGAAVPPGADTVVMQEKTKIQNDRLAIADENIVPGLNVRTRGSEIKAGGVSDSKRWFINAGRYWFPGQHWLYAEVSWYTLILQ